MPKMLNMLNEHQKTKNILSFNMWHQTGSNHYKHTNFLYAKLKMDVKIEPFN